MKIRWLLLLFLASAVQAQEVRPWLFFDLGDTLLGTEEDPATGDLSRLWWTRFEDENGRVVSAHEYLTRMKALGYRVGLIVNIPQFWGDPGLTRARAWLAEPSPVRRRELAADLTAIKIQTIADYFEGRGPGDSPRQPRRWGDPDFPAMDWAVFSPEGHLVPFFDENRKPDKRPHVSDDQLLLFHQALEIARRSGAGALYQGENAHEIRAARVTGLVARQVPHQAGAAVQPRGFFLSDGEIRRAIRESTSLPAAALESR